MPLLLRREYDPARLLAAHPPRLYHPHKQQVFELACPPGAAHAGPIELTRWSAAALPATVAALAPTSVEVVSGHFDYAGDSAGVWHVNFADPQLFVAYGSPLLAQDELQCAEHPLLGSLREALLAEGEPALTEHNLEPTPVLVANAERRCALALAPDLDAGRPYGLYGNQFARASTDAIRRATQVLTPPTRTNLIAIAAPTGRGEYLPAQIHRILVTAYTGFLAAATESRRLWPAAPTELRTGFWGCGAFGGNRSLMALLQVLAARLAGLERVRFYAFDDAGRAAFDDGAAALAHVLATGGGDPDEPLAALLERIDDLDYEWGTPNGT